MNIDPQAATTVGGELQSLAVDLVQRLGEGPISSVAEYEHAVTDRQEIGRAITTVHNFFKPLKALAHQLHKGLCDRENAILDPLQQRDRARAAAISAYKTIEDARRREAERVEAERRRQEQERHAVSEAAALESQGDTALASVIVAEALAAPSPVVVLADPLRGIAKFVTRWHCRIVNEALVPREFLQVDERKLAAYGRSMKASAHVPGVEFYSTEDPVR